MQINLIYAKARNGVIGNKGKLPWHLPEDLERFKQKTMGYPVIMGRKTWDSLPNKFRPLPGRTNIVLTRQPGWKAEGAVRALGIVNALFICEKIDPQPERIWVIGGEQIYTQALPFADTIIVTEIDTDFEGDAHAPVLGPDWRETSRESYTSSTGLPFYFVNYARNQL